MPKSKPEPKVIYLRVTIGANRTKVADITRQVDKVADYMWHGEATHYEETPAGGRRNHIFSALCSMCGTTPRKELGDYK